MDLFLKLKTDGKSHNTMYIKRVMNKGTHAYGLCCLWTSTYTSANCDFKNINSLKSQF